MGQDPALGRGGRGGEGDRGRDRPLQRRGVSPESPAGGTPPADPAALARHLDRIRVVEGDITRADVDALVNAANAALKRGGGVDGAIHRAAGRGLQEELDGIGGCPTGECRLSGPHAIPVKALIHCVGPVWRGGGAGEERDLAACYRNALDLARRHGLKSLAFPAISTGIYGFPPDRAAEIAVATVLEGLAADPPDAPTLSEIRFVCFDAATAGLYRSILGTL